MHNVIKGIYFDNGSKPVEIPDTVILRKKTSEEKDTLKSVDFNLRGYKKSDVDKLDEYFNLRENEMLDSVNKQAEELEEKAGEIIAAAKAQAEEIEARANSNSEAIIENAKNLAEEIYEEARQIGKNDGKREVVDRVNECFTKLDETLTQLGSMQTQTNEQTQQQLKYMALEIAQKLVNKKISDDDSYLAELVNGALKEIKEADWITVTVSDKMQGLVKKLRQEQLDGLKVRNLDVVADNSPVGTVRIESSDRIIDASLATQLENVKHYFDTYGDEEDGQVQG